MPLREPNTPTTRLTPLKGLTAPFHPTKAAAMEEEPHQVRATKMVAEEVTIPPRSPRKLTNALERKKVTCR